MTQPCDPLCADCGIPLSPDEVYVCEGCCEAMFDPNFNMTGDDDD